VLDSFILGAAQFGQKYGVTGDPYADQEVVESALSSPEEFGIVGIDTSPEYGDSEKIIGKFLTKNLPITTKVKYLNNSINQTITQSVFDSLDRLKVDKIESVLIHDWDKLSLIEKEAAMSHLVELKSERLVSNIGFSTYDLLKPDFKNLLTQEIDIIQLPVSILDQRRIQVYETLQVNRPEISISVRSIFLQGLAILGLKKNGTQNESILKFWEWCKIKNISPTEACVFFARDLEVDSIVIGVKTMNELLEVSRLMKTDFMSNTFEWSEIASEDAWLLNPLNWI
jgi:aryl-alcohol dehydrogenase-like predicted oxidoreductase